MIETIVRWYRRLRLKAHKSRALFEAECDLAWLKTARAEVLVWDEGKMRARMAELNRKESLDADEEAELEAVEAHIAKYNATRREVLGTEELIASLKSYISSL